jgi:hypothetical protein
MRQRVRGIARKGLQNPPLKDSRHPLLIVVIDLPNKRSYRNGASLSNFKTISMRSLSESAWASSAVLEPSPTRFHAYTGLKPQISQHEASLRQLLS